MTKELTLSRLKRFSNKNIIIGNNDYLVESINKYQIKIKNRIITDNNINDWFALNDKNKLCYKNFDPMGNFTLTILKTL